MTYIQLWRCLETIFITLLCTWPPLAGSARCCNQIAQLSFPNVYCFLLYGRYCSKYWFVLRISLPIKTPTGNSGTTWNSFYSYTEPIDIWSTAHSKMTSSSQLSLITSTSLLSTIGGWNSSFRNYAYQIKLRADHETAWIQYTVVWYVLNTKNSLTLNEVSLPPMETSPRTLTLISLTWTR